MTSEEERSWKSTKADVEWCVCVCVCVCVAVGVDWSVTVGQLEGLEVSARS